MTPTSALASPSGVAADGSRSVYIADSGNNRVLKEAFATGSYSESAVSTSPLNYPEAVAVDGRGNLYVADTYNNRVLLEALSSNN